MSATSGTQVYKPTPFAERLQRHMKEWRERIDGSSALRWRRWTDGVYPAYRGLVETVVRTDSVKLSGQVDHLRSSQVFAFNLFLPFRWGGRALLSERVSDMVGARLTIDKVRFEWVPPGKILGELDGERPVGDEPATAVDVVLWGKLENGHRAVVLVEVKLSERDFTHCGGRTSPRNHRKDICASAKRFFDDPRSCYLRRPWRKQRDRRYWEIFTASHGSVRAAFPGTELDGTCPFSYSMQQPMRNLAIARGLEQEQDGAAEKAWFALCAHNGNTDIAEYWKGWQSLLPDASMAPSLPASEVVSIGEADKRLKRWAAYMRERYQLHGEP